jgi:hypothetical protein
MHVITLRKWYAEHKRVPGWNEFNGKHGLPTHNTLIRHFQADSVDEIMGAVLGIETVRGALERFVKEKSHDMTKAVFYANSRDIARETGFSAGRIRVVLRDIFRQRVPVINGYEVKRQARGSKTVYTYAFTRI